MKEGGIGNERNVGIKALFSIFFLTVKVLRGEVLILKIF